MLIIGLFVYATALAQLEAVEVESNILVPLSAGLLFGSRNWNKKHPSQYRNSFKPFRYVNDLKILFRRMSADDCGICYGDDDCFVMNHARCDYYVYTAKIVDAEESGETLDTAPELKFEVDSMVYNLIDRASGDPRYTDCIPLLSRYTDCTKDNICLGCKTCECDVEGRWNCTLLARCRPESDLHDIDQRMLRSVIENIKKYQEVVRRKRSEPTIHETTPQEINIPIKKVFDGVQESSTEASELEIKTLLFNSNNSNDTEKTNSKNFTPKLKLDSSEIAEWLQEMHLDIKENKSENSVLTPKIIEDTFPYILTTVNINSTKYESDYLAFDEVLNNISVDSKNFSRKKPMPNISPNDNVMDYMTDNEDISVATEKYIYDPNIFYNTVTQSSYNNLEKAAVTEAIEKSITEIVIDLLESAKINDNLNYLNDKSYDLLDYMDISDRLNTTFPQPRPDQDDISEINSVNIMKREVHNITASTKSLNATTTIVTTDKTTENIITTTVSNNNKTKPNKHIDDLNKNVIDPLTNILNQKEKEIEELTKIKKNIVIFMDDFKNGQVNFSCTSKNESLFNNYRQQIITKIKSDVKTSNMTTRDKYSLKLKRDVYEVIKDIVGIQKLSDPMKLPEDLKFLIRAMKHYVHKQGFHIKSKIKKENFRRRWNTVGYNSYDPIRENVINILEVINRNMPLLTGLYPLSKGAKKVLTRIIKRHYIDEFAMIGLRVYDPNYNLTNDLRNIGTKWKKMMDSVSESPPSDELYTTKLLHLELSIDVSKMNDALSLIKFAQRRSMVPVDEVIGEEIISQISDSLDKINQKIVHVVQKGARSIKKRTKYWPSGMLTSTKSTLPKLSFLQQIKSLLHNSKRDLLDLIRKKVPKTDVLKELARKQLDINRNKLSQYEKTMSSWQHNFGVLPNNVRDRRGSDFADRRDRNRIKNIIPRYLRGKVRPAINKKSNKKSKSKKSKNNNSNLTKTSSSSTSTSSTSKSTRSGAKISTTVVSPTKLSTTSLKPYQTSKKP